ncbi:MAG: CBS domain-containing protein [Bacteriovoracaceae bacterium]|nr:CBS domain-containing protein [Bacteriovoracaceae bacterium]
MSRIKNINLDTIDKSKFDVPISELSPRAIVSISGDASLQDLVELLIKENQGSVCVVDGSKLIGIVSERDLFMNVDDDDFDQYLKKSVSDIMTPNPLTKFSNDTIASCLKLMGIRRVRSLPIVNENGEPSHMLTAHDMLAFIIKLFPHSIKNIGTLFEWTVSEVHVQDENFSFTSSPHQLSGNIFLSPLKSAVSTDILKVDQNEIIQDVIKKMQARKRGMVAITCFETELVGILTERDLLRKVFGKVDLCARVRISELMTPSPVTLLEKHAVSYAINNMFEKRFRNIILVDEEKTPISSVSVIDLVKFVTDKLI